MHGNRITKNHWVILAFLFISLIGSLSLWQVLRVGVGAWHDSIFYLTAAESFLNGKGISIFNTTGQLVPLTHFPPLYPLLLAFTSAIIHAPVLIAAKIDAVVLFGGLIFLSGFLVWYYSKNWPASIIASLLVLSSPVILEQAQMAMTEIPFLILIGLSIFIFERYLSTENRTLMIVEGIILSLAYLLRYAGAYLFAVVILISLFFPKISLKKRLTDIALLVAAGAIGILAWSVRNYLIEGSSTDRSYFFHPIRAANLISAFQSIELWFLPVFTHIYIRIIVYLVILILICLGIYYLLKNHDPLIRIVGLMVSAQVFYILFLLISLTFFDASTRLDDRILSPVYYLSVLLICILFGRYFGEKKVTKVVRYGILILLIGLVFLNSLKSIPTLQQTYSEGIGFTGQNWKNSATLRVIQSLPEKTLIYSNQPMPVSFYSKVTADWLPEIRNTIDDSPNLDYQKQVLSMQSSIDEQNGLLVIFTPEEKWLIDTMSKDLIPVLSCSDGVFYSAQGSTIVSRLSPQPGCH